MATILAYTSPSFGNLYPLLSLLVELQSRGHRIVVRTMSDALRLAGELGFDASAIDPRIEAVAMTDWMAPNPRAALRKAFRAFAERSAFEVDDIRASIDLIEPDVSLIDANCWGAPAVVDAASLPWLSFWPYPPMLESRTVPPFGPGLRPWPGPWGRLRDAALRTVIAKAIDEVMLEPLNQICARVGAKRLASSRELPSRAPLILVTSAQPFEYPHPDWDDRVQMIGPCEFEPHVAGGTAWLEAIDHPLVLVTTSSERQDDMRLPLAVLDALRDRHIHVVATFPCGVPENIAAQKNATVARFLPHGAVLDRAVCAITHGGMGATQKALARGVPACVVPFGRDQFEVARRVEVARCGTRLTSKRLTASRLRSKIDEAMTMGDGARVVAQGYAAAGGVGRGADLVESRLLRLGPAAEV
jgi:MGT family glycosyltransferase